MKSQFCHLNYPILVTFWSRKFCRFFPCLTLQFRFGWCALRFPNLIIYLIALGMTTRGTLPGTCPMSARHPGVIQGASKQARSGPLRGREKVHGSLMHQLQFCSSLDVIHHIHTRTRCTYRMQTWPMMRDGFVSLWCAVESGLDWTWIALSAVHTVAHSFSLPKTIN